MNLVEHWIDRSASCWARSARSGVKCPRSTPSLSESWVSMVDESANSTNRALSAGRNRPNPSAIVLVADAAEARIWLQKSKSFDTGPVAISAYTSRFSSSAICHASSSWYRLTPAMHGQASISVPNRERRTANREPRTTNDERRTTNDERERRTQNGERRTSC